MAPRGRIARRGIAAALVVAALVAGGCGDDEEEQDTGLSRSELVTQATAICKAHYAKISAAANKVLAGGQLPDPREFGMLAMGTIVPELQAQNSELAALDPADDVAAAYDAWVSDAQATVEKIKQNPALVTDAKNFAAVNGKAKALGMPMQCNIGPG